MTRRRGVLALSWSLSWVVMAATWWLLVDTVRTAELVAGAVCAAIAATCCSSTSSWRGAIPTRSTGWGCGDEPVAHRGVGAARGARALRGGVLSGLATGRAGRARGGRDRRHRDLRARRRRRAPRALPRARARGGGAHVRRVAVLRAAAGGRPVSAGE